MIVIEKPTSCFNWQLLEPERFPPHLNELSDKEDFELLFQETVDPAKLKEILRSSTRDANQAVRKFLWKRILLNNDVAQTKLTAEKYTQKIAILFGKQLNLQAELPDFVDKSHLVFYYLNGEGRAAVSRLLNVLAAAHPDITFAPLLVPLASLFLHYMNEAECYACLLAVVESNNKVTQTDIHWVTTNQVFRRFAQKYAHLAYEYVLEAMYKQTSDSEVCFEAIDDWTWWIFEHLPFDYVLNIVDSFLLEGQKVLYRYGVAVLDSFYKSYAHDRPLSLEPTFMRDYCAKIPVPLDRLVKSAFGLRNMSRKDIESIFQAEEKAIKKLRAKNSENHLSFRERYVKSNSAKEYEFRKKSNSIIGPFLKPYQHSHLIEDSSEKLFKSTSNLVQPKSESTKQQASAMGRAGSIWSAALKTLRYTTPGSNKWHQSATLKHTSSFYHHHHPQSNINLPSFSVENTGSAILSPQQIALLWRWLPSRYQILELQVIYSTNIHGCRMMTLFDKIEFYQATILVVQTSRQAIFGAFCSQQWSDRLRNTRSLRPSFFGNGETFLFELAPSVERFEWIGKSKPDSRRRDTTANQELFMYADHEKLIVGGGHEKGIGLRIDADLIHGHTSVSDTFENKVLGDDAEFEIEILEVLSFNSG